MDAVRGGLNFGRSAAILREIRDATEHAQSRWVAVEQASSPRSLAGK
ncbi:MAG TPA: hypothetical protein VGE52_17920 [Pirellulales bacterium]